MADEDSSSSGGFRRERNLSNRNFNKPGTSRRRVSTDSYSSSESKSLNNSPTKADDTVVQKVEDDGLSSFDFTDSSDLNSELVPLIGSSTDYTVRVKSEPKLLLLESEHSSKRTSDGTSTLDDQSELKTEFNDAPDVGPYRHSAGVSPLTYKRQLQQQNLSSQTSSSPDPALLGVKQKLLMFEKKLNPGEQPSTSKFKSKSAEDLLDSERASSSSSHMHSILLQAYPTIGSDKVGKAGWKNTSIEEHSEDEVESLRDEVNEDYLLHPHSKTGSPASARAKKQDVPVDAINTLVSTPPLFRTPLHSESEEAKAVNPYNVQSPVEETVGIDSATEGTPLPTQKPKKKDFPRNFRSRPKTETLETTSEPSLSEPGRYHSYHSKQNSAEPDEYEQIELRDKGFSFVQPILEELIKTEEAYVKNLWIGIKNYGKIFERKDLRPGLRGKKYVLFGNIEQIAEFHRDEFLPMLQRNKQDLKRIFDEFQRYIDNNYFYGYVLFTMNKQRSLELCETYKNYFKLLQNEIDDKLGINSFLVQPIQRMARYPLLLQQFINTLFKKHREYEMKPTIESCCRLEKKLRNLLITTNESESINDIVGTSDANEFNTFYQGKFRKVSEFHCFDHTLKRSYRSKIFIFDKCIIYTEIKGKQLILHGRYPCEHIGIVSKLKQFTLFYEHRKQQECDFTGDPSLVEQWLELITDMIKSYAEEERRKLKELHSREFGGDHMHRKPANLSLFRDSNRFSSDSGIGNIWFVPKPDQDDAVSNRTTWYALT